MNKLSLDKLLDDDHPARLIDRWVAGFDFTTLLEPIRAREGCPGAPVHNPRVLFALWLFATVEGITSARELAQLCGRDLPYLWLSGQTRPNYHTLADFFSQNEAFLTSAFQEHLEALVEQGLVTLKQVTLDGRKIPAAAGKESFHREPTLNRHQQEVEDHLAKLAAQKAAEEQTSQRKKAARQRAAAEKQERLKAALAKVKERQEERAANHRKDRSPPEEARASETDAEARKMKLSHGGFVPAYNVQTVVDAEMSLIVAVEVTDRASDNGLLAPMLDLMEELTGRPAEQALVDAGYVSQEDIEAVEAKGTKLYMPPKNEKKELKEGKDPYEPKRRDSQPVAIWRTRMGTPEARAIYRRRAPVAEGVHAQQSNGGWKRLRLRGLVKAGLEALWQALAHNVRVLMSRNRLSDLAVRAAVA